MNDLFYFIFGILITLQVYNFITSMKQKKELQKLMDELKKRLDIK